MTLGLDDYRYRLVPDWGDPAARARFGIVTAVATDANDRVYVADREPNDVIRVFERDGAYVETWGQDFLKRPHSIWIGPDQLAYITDIFNHTVEICRLDGTVVQTIGNRGRAGAPGAPFNRPTWAVRAPWGDLYVSDGYGQQRMHRFTPEGDLVRSWGMEGGGPGQFRLPHCVKVDPRGRLLVIDRSNERIQVFDREGGFIEEWTEVRAANDLVIDDRGVIHLAEAGGTVALIDPDGRVIGRWGRKGSEPGQFVGAPHGIWEDSRGDLYVCEVPFERDRLQKFERV